jgi:hypothetical protein
MTLVSLLVLLCVLALVFYLLAQYVVPLLPQPLGRILLALFALAVVVWLLFGYAVPAPHRVWR